MHCDRDAVKYFGKIRQNVIGPVQRMMKKILKNDLWEYTFSYGWKHRLRTRSGIEFIEEKKRSRLFIYEFSSQPISVWRITNIHNRNVHHPESGPIWQKPKPTTKPSYDVNWNTTSSYLLRNSIRLVDNNVKLSVTNDCGWRRILAFMHMCTHSVCPSLPRHTRMPVYSSIIVV